jgi:four helix bundle protein
MFIGFGGGTSCERTWAMAGARRYEELAVWQLAVELRDRVVRSTQSGPGARDWKFIAQLQDAAASAPRNLAEGFGHFHPREFARFTRIARASLLETRNHLQDGRSRGYLSAGETEELLRLNARAIGAATSLLRYLHTCGGKAPTGWSVPKTRTKGGT